MILKFRVPIQCNICKFKGFQYYHWNGQSFMENGYDNGCTCKNPSAAAFEIASDIEAFTGILDCDGLEIYENDKVVVPNNFPWYDYKDYDPQGDTVKITNIYTTKNPLVGETINCFGTVEWEFSKWQVIMHSANPNSPSLCDGEIIGFNDGGLDDGCKSDWKIIGNTWIG